MKFGIQSIGDGGSVWIMRLRIRVRVGFAGSCLLRDVTYIRFALHFYSSDTISWQRLTVSERDYNILE